MLQQLASISSQLDSGGMSVELAGKYTETSLRRFELAYLRLLGYGFGFERCANSGAAVMPDCYYRFDPQNGFVITNALTQTSVTDSNGATLARNLQRVPGSVLLDIAADNFENSDVLYYAKLVCRALFKPMLGGKPLHSRDLFS